MRRSLLLIAAACLVLTFSASAGTGLNYAYYEGNWTAMPDFTAITPTKTGSSNNLDLGVRNRDTYFSILWQGYITIPADGFYTFELNSDDGSKLYIGNYNPASTPLINNDGLHGTRTVAGSQFLYKGIFPIAISYFQNSGINQMELYWSSTSGISRQKVPDNALMNNYSGTVNSFSGLNYSYVEGIYNLLPDFFTQSKVKTGNSSNIDLGIRNKNIQYAMLWEGYINIPADGVYTFETNSDDGSKVYLGLYNNGTSPLVNNEGNHGVQTRKGVIFLTAGVYPIAVSYYQNSGDQTMELYWSSTAGLARQQIPDDAFKSNGSTNKDKDKDNGSTGGNISYKYYEGKFSNLPDFSSLTPAKTGSSSTFDLGVRDRSAQYAIVWQANITLPASATYTFETVSDDGSKLYLGSYGPGSTPLLDNDGVHGTQSRSTSLYLAAGSYTITVQYFQSAADQTMEVYWTSSAGIARQRIPDNAFTPYLGYNVVNSVSKPETPTAPDLSGSNETGGLTGRNNYYFSSSTGDDSRSNAQAQNPATPWKSLDKLNSIIPYLGDNDAVLLKRGDVFDGSISIKRTWNQSSAIIVSSYGTGNKPVINGFATLSNWSNLGGGIWSSYYNYSGSRINVVTINGEPKEMGRYPNANDPLHGYLIYDSHTYDGTLNTGSITDNEYNSSINWTGGELALRKRRWVVDQCPILYQAGNTFYYKSPSFYPGLDGFGYFIQNHPKTLDQYGEWYFDPNSKNLQVYLGSVSPYNIEVKESVVDVLFTVLGQSNITIDNLSLQGANQKAISVGSSNNIKITNCNIFGTGVNAIDANYTNNLNIEGCNVSRTNNVGMFLGPNINNSLIRNNKLTYTGLFAGMGANSDNARQGIALVGDNDIVEYNEVYNTGYNGIKFKGNSITVRNNVVNTFCTVSDDGGGIYTYAGGFYGRKILNNIIVNGPGASDGTDSYLDYAANGIDLDDMTNDVEMSGNSIASCNGRGIGNHNSHELVITNNTVYDCDMGQIEFAHDLLAPNDPIRNVSMNNNIFVSKRADQQVVIFRTKDNDVSRMGGLDNNYFCRPINDKEVFTTYTYFNTPSVIPKWYDLSHWKSTYGFDANSSKSPVNIAPYSINSTSGNMVTNGSFDNSIKNMQTPTGYYTSLQFDRYGLDGGDVKVSYTGGNRDNSYQSIQFYDPTTPTMLSGHTYRIKFSVLAASDNNTDFFGTFLGAYGVGRTDAKLFKVNNTRSEIELLFTPTTNVSNPYFEIYTPIAMECPVFWIDNLVLQEVYSMTKTNPDDYLRFEYNSTTSTKNISLDGAYVDMKNNTYNNSITLAPFSSAVLVRKGAGGLVTDAQNVLSANTTAARTMTAVEETTTADNLALSSELKLTPNPAVDQVQFTLKPVANANSKAVLKIYSAAGTLANSSEVSVTGQPITVNVSSLSPGVYTMNIVYGGHTISKKFVKR
ncbi:MAG: right-handed parallel beta-helix repeat-containing protein [Williamsia sp.]|nr:right-handed parallel beta-helix repeat-containing protein [Williamsia sp.]